MAQKVTVSETTYRLVWRRFNEKYYNFLNIFAAQAKQRYGVKVEELFAKNPKAFREYLEKLYGKEVWTFIAQTLEAVILELVRTRRIHAKEGEILLKRILGTT